MAHSPNKYPHIDVHARPDAHRRRKWQRASLLYCLVNVACGHAPHLLPLSTYPATLEQQTEIPPYAIRGGAWVAERPLLVNSDFDFTMAMFDASMGPAMAAAKRLSQNKEVASRLTHMPDPAFEAAMNQALKECVGGCQRLSRQNVRIFSVLFGQPVAQLQTVLQVLDDTSSPRYFVRISPSFDLKSYWLLADGQAIAQQMRSDIQPLFQLATTLPRRSASSRPADTSCKAGGTLRFNGQAVNEGQDEILMATSENTYVLCPRSAVTKPAPPLTPHMPPPPSDPPHS